MAKSLVFNIASTIKPNLEAGIRVYAVHVGQWCWHGQESFVIPALSPNTHITGVHGPVPVGERDIAHTAALLLDCYLSRGVTLDKRDLPPSDAKHGHPSVTVRWDNPFSCWRISYGPADVEQTYGEVFSVNVARATDMVLFWNGWGEHRRFGVKLRHPSGVQNVDCLEVDPVAMMSAMQMLAEHLVAQSNMLYAKTHTSDDCDSEED